jgi:hypothetical protein
MQFRLYDAITGGNQIGTLLSRPNTVLVNGVFSVTLDFGASAFNSPVNYFIEISVRPTASPNAFTILGPRQQLTVVPFALHSVKADNADNAINATNSQNAVNATSALAATNATNATNSLNLGGVAAAGYAKLDVVNPGQLIMDGNVRQSGYSNGLVKAMLEVNEYGLILGCYNGATNSTTGNCGFIVTLPLTGVFRINFGFPVSGRFVAVSTFYTTGLNEDKNGGANYRAFDATSVEVFTFSADNSADTAGRHFTLIMF